LRDVRGLGAPHQPSAQRARRAHHDRQVGPIERRGGRVRREGLEAVSAATPARTPPQRPSGGSLPRGSGTRCGSGCSPRAPGSGLARSGAAEAVAQELTDLYEPVQEPLRGRDGCGRVGVHQNRPTCRGDEGQRGPRGRGRPAPLDVDGRRDSAENPTGAAANKPVIERRTASPAPRRMTATAR
jgi:hypothetical protein